jgi:hypothetical protein
MVGGSIINALIGAGVKIGANFINAWIEQKRQDQLLLAARDEKMLTALIENQKSQASSPFVQVTRRILFLTITFTLCFLMIYYALNPDITYNVVVPRGDNAKWGLFSWLVGGTDWVVVQMTGGLMLASFIDLCFMVIGFYAIPSRRR